LRDEPLLLLREGHCFGETAVAACKRAHLDPQIVFEGGQFSSILGMVSACLGISIVPEMAIDKRGAVFWRCQTTARRARSGAITRKGKSATRLQEALLGHARAWASRAPAEQSPSSRTEI
jgi:LysR family hydrogen peroxide-inducible transcriptional activator